MKTTISDADYTDAKVVAWVGPAHDELARHAKTVCEQHADAVATFDSLSAIADRPFRIPITHCVLEQSGRGECLRFASETKSSLCGIPTLRWLGPMVSPSVGMPGQPGWIDTITWRDSDAVLPGWISGQSLRSNPPIRGVIVVSDSWSVADSILDAIDSMGRGFDCPIPPMTWMRRGLTRSERFGPANVIWDDSIWSPQQSGSHRLPKQHRHIWLTGMATPGQVSAAKNQGMADVWNKPTRRESLQSLLTR